VPGSSQMRISLYTLQFYASKQLRHRVQLKIIRTNKLYLSPMHHKLPSALCFHTWRFLLHSYCFSSSFQQILFIYLSSYPFLHFTPTHVFSFPLLQTCFSPFTNPNFQLIQFYSYPVALFMLFFFSLFLLQFKRLNLSLFHFLPSLCMK